MAYQGYERNPSGKGYKSYKNTDTGEIISYRQYRNVTYAQKLGYDSISQLTRSLRGEEFISNRQQLRRIYHDLDYAPIALIEKRAAVIANKYDSKTNIALVIDYVFIDDPRQTVHTMQTQPVRNKDTTMAVEMLKDFLASLKAKYQDIEVINYSIVAYPA